SFLQQQVHVAPASCRRTVSSRYGPTEALLPLRSADGFSIAYFGLFKNKCTTNITKSTPPKVQTIVAPVGRSQSTERYTPSAETSVPIVQPIARRRPMVSAN